ncbi:MAG: hypothetical protein NC432_10260 [Roseburia sp.]|nr:hypothetical protein [Roseburia sp.]MCM1097279.1 hypothetical protein [Ruminococcus flavefaciens]
MLGKLIKHEWKNTWRAGCLFLVSLAAITSLGWLAFQSPMWRGVAEYEYMYSHPVPMAILDIASVFTLLLYVLMLAAASLGILICIVLQFYRTMYSGEGYLTHTLPVTKNQLLVSKILVGGVWLLIVALGIILSAVGLFSFMVASTVHEYSVGEFWRLVFKEVGEIFRMMEVELDLELGARMVFGIAGLVISPFLSLITIFGAISLGQLFTRHRVLMAIVCYIGVQMAGGLLQTVLEVIFAPAAYRGIEFDLGRNILGYVDANSLISYGVEVLLAVGMYLASYLVTTKKLNLE